MIKKIIITNTNEIVLETKKKKKIIFKKIMKKLHFITLNYTSDYTLHLKLLFECTFCTLTYDRWRSQDFGSEGAKLKGNI